MIERKGDLWKIADELGAVAITTNGSIRQDGSAVMGRGCALEATKIIPTIQPFLGRVIKETGNHVYLLAGIYQQFSHVNIRWWFSFPVKHRWMEDANDVLIGRSTEELVAVVTALGIKGIALPRPGCGNGRLRWSVVHGLIEHLLDDRFTVVGREGEE